jgi:hypothetical protein
MANLKLDLLNKLRTDKYYAEIELVRLAQDPNCNYLFKISDMQQKLNEIALINASLGLAEQYFQEPAPAAAPTTAPTGPVVNAPQGQVHPGQTHGE